MFTFKMANQNYILLTSVKHMPHLLEISNTTRVLLKNNNFPKNIFYHLSLLTHKQKLCRITNNLFLSLFFYAIEF